jgi:hypothetical protein
VTALNIIKQKDAVHLVSDGAAYDAKQRLVSIGPKVWPLPHINAAIGVRGPTIALPLLAHFVGHAVTSYDALKINIAAVLRNAFANTHGVLGQSAAGAAFEIAIGGISETVGADAYVVACSADGVVSPLTQITELGFMPTCETIDSFVLMQMAKHLRSNSPINEIDPADFGLQTIEMQRAAKFGDHNTCHVGGFAQITTVRAGGIETKLLRRWPDEVGELLNDNTLTAVSGAIGALSIGSLSLAGQAVTVPSAQNFSAVLSSSGSVLSSFNLSVDTTGLSGQSIVIYVSTTILISPFQTAIISSSVSFSFNLQVNSAVVVSTPGGAWQTPNASLSGSITITGNGSVMSIPVSVSGSCNASGTFTATGTLFAIAAKR